MIRGYNRRAHAAIGLVIGRRRLSLPRYLRKSRDTDCGRDWSAGVQRRWEQMTSLLP